MPPPPPRTEILGEMLGACVLKAGVCGKPKLTVVSIGGLLNPNGVGGLFGNGSAINPNGIPALEKGVDDDNAGPGPTIFLQCLLFLSLHLLQLQ